MATNEELARLLFMQSGQQQAPPQHPYPWAQVTEDPFERAAMVRQQREAPPGHLIPQATPGEQAQAAAMMVPVAGMAARGIAAAPKIATALMGGGALAAGTSDAGEASDKVDPRLGEINQLQTSIANAENEITRLGTTRTPSPKGTQEMTIKTLQVGLERNSARLRELQDVLNAEAAAKAQAERPFREEYPNAYRMLPLAGWGLSALGGALGARAGHGLKSAAYGAVGGIPGSAGAAIAPTAYDAATLPTGSRNQAQAKDWLMGGDDYWQGRVVPEAAVGSLVGGTAGKLTSQGLTLLQGLGQGTSSAGTPTPSQGQSRPIQSGGAWRDPSTGRFASPPPPSAASRIGRMLLRKNP